MSNEAHTITTISFYNFIYNIYINNLYRARINISLKLILRSQI